MQGGEMRQKKVAWIMPVVATVLLLASSGYAQTVSTGTIAGVVKDTGGGVLPGVTVEVTSPALIEKTRTTVTGGQGQYRVVDLRPGLYSVTFTLPGFGPVRQEAIELTAGFTAPINAELGAAAIEETVVVTGAS